MTLRPTAIVSDWHSWRQTDTQTIAINFLRPGASILFPQINWGADGPGYVETEFQLYTRLTSLGMAVFGVHEWIGQLVSLLAIVLAAATVFAHLSSRYRWLPAVLGLGAFLAARSSPSLATVVMPDAVALLAYIAAWTFFVKYAIGGRVRDVVLFGLIGTIAMLTKPTLAHLGISSFCLVALGYRARLRDWRLWATWVAMVAIFGLYLFHAHRLYTHYGNTFGLLFGEDSKVPHLRYLLSPSVWTNTVRIAVPWGLGVVGTAVILAQALRRRLDAEQIALAVGNAAIVVVALRYMSEGQGVHYYAPVSLLVATVTASLADDLREMRRWGSIALATLVVLILWQGYRSTVVRYFYAHVFASDPTIASIVDTGAELDRLTSAGDLVIVRSPNVAYDTFWQQAINYHDPRIFYMTMTRGWTLGREQDDTVLLAEATSRGARFMADPLLERSPVLDSWLTANAALVWSGASGGRIWALHSNDRQKGREGLDAHER
jgi:4-amino-4-deoxy-L-arabinose transferase-like glycosyltransferase